MPILLSFRDLMRDSQITDDRCDDRFRKLLHLQCASLNQAKVTLMHGLELENKYIHTILVPFYGTLDFGIIRVSRYQNQSGCY